MSKKLDEAALRKLLKEQCDKAGGQKNWATSAGVSTAYVSDVLNNRRSPGDAISKALGLRRIPDHWEHQDDLKKDNET